MRGWVVVTVIVLGIVLVIFYIKGNYYSTYGYCSLENKCPGDKCNSIMTCTGGGSGLGCIISVTGCEFKDNVIKWGYRQITAEQAKTCVTEFIRNNREKYIWKKPVDPGSKLSVSGTNRINEGGTDESMYWVGPIDIRDKYVWRISINRGEMHVGAQTCKVYPNKNLFLENN